MRVDAFEEVSNPPKKVTAFRVAVAITMAYILFYTATTFSYHLGMGLPMADISNNSIPDISILHHK